MTSGFDGSYCFDRAANYYDDTRKFPSEFMERVFALLTPELEGRDPVLEIGVGTGRIALGLSTRGIPIVGSDLSSQMMEKLVAKAGGRAPFPLLRADATRLPFRDHSFDAVLACWVLHLIPRWEDAVTEIARVTRPGGVFLVNQGGWGQGWFEEAQIRFADEAGTTKKFAGLSSPEELDAAMSKFAAGVRIPEPLGYQEADTLSEQIDRLERGLYSWTWRISPEDRTRAADNVRAWARERFGDLDERREFDYYDTWRFYDL